MIKGRNANEFAPNEKLTRAELVKIALLALEEIDESELSSSKAQIFADVDPEAWYADYVAKAKELNIVDGYSDGTFRPNQTVNRAEAIKILLGAKKIAETTLEETAQESENSFKDVPKNAWFSKYVLYAKKQGIVSGYANDVFKPENKITRAEIAKIAVMLEK